MKDDNKPKPYPMKDARRRNPYVDEATWQKCREIGNGNASEGIRRAVAAYKEKPDS